MSTTIGRHYSRQDTVEQGRADARDGKDFDANPCVTSMHRLAWEEGWLAEKTRQQKAEDALIAEVGGDG